MYFNLGTTHIGTFNYGNSDTIYKQKNEYATHILKYIN